MEHQDNPPILDLSIEPLLIIEGTIFLGLYKVGKTTYVIPDDATPEQRHSYELLNGDAGDWDALIDAKGKTVWMRKLRTRTVSKISKPNKVR